MNYPEKLKLVIWDLDETFWEGTLSEGNITIIEKNMLIVKELTNRGIVNSISSKNNYEDVLDKLIELEINDYFVFPKINWKPKGDQIKNTISEMGLRDINCIFIDDNKLNLKEVKHRCENIYTYLPEDIIDKLLELPCAKGKDDKKHSRLKQYKILQEKVKAKQVSNDSNIDFLEKCEINISIDHNCENYIERIIELIDRTNQLNFTKKRFENSNEVSQFKKLLNHYQTNAAVIKCSDKFGDYGVVGFYLLRKENDIRGFLEHFVFSCRIINMGIESYIYEKLGRPKIEIKEPIAYQIDEYKPAKWIKESSKVIREEKSNNTLLLGPCHLLQISNFFDTDLNFFQYLNNNSIIKFDCPAFLQSDFFKISNSGFIKSGFVWSTDDYCKFHESLKKVDRIILSLEDLFIDNKYVKDGELLIRYEGNNKIKFETESIPMNDRVSILIEFLDYVLDIKKDNCDVFILDSLVNNKTPRNIIQSRIVYSHVIHKHFCNKISIIDMSFYENKKAIFGSDGVHLDRLSYYNIYNDIISNKINVKLVDYSNFVGRHVIKARARLFLKRKFGAASFVYKFGRFIYFLPGMVKRKITGFI